MLAIVVKKGTKYECKDDNDRDLLCMQSQFQRELNMLAISFDRDQKFLQKSKILWRDSSKNHTCSHLTPGQFSTLQAYLVPIERDCKYI